jgi:putative oxidoreductase
MEIRILHRCFFLVKRRDFWETSSHEDTHHDHSDLLGLVFVVFGSNGFLQFLPMPPLPHGITGEFLHAFFASHYVYAVAACQVVGGLFLILGRFVPLGLTILGPVIVNIVLFHIFLAAEGLPLALVIAALFVFLLWRYWAAFAAILRP